MRIAILEVEERGRGIRSCRMSLRSCDEVWDREYVALGRIANGTAIGIGIVGEK